MSALGMQEIFDRLRAQFSDKEVLSFFDPATAPPDPKLKRAGDCHVQIAADAIVKVCTFLKDQPELLFNSMMCLSGIDEIAEPPAYCVVYHLHSFKHRHRVALKVRLPKDNPTIKSVTSVWNAANWFEREAFDLVGIQFENHPDLRRILLPPDWVGYPLRKDYEFPKEYNGISCTRAKLK